MSTISGILSAAARALVTQQKVMQVTANNINNAASEGYSRQRATLAAAPPLVTADGVIGMGVQITDINRVRDPLLDATWRRQNGTAGFFAERSQQLGRLEQVFGEPSDNGLLATMDQFWNAWSDLAADPLSDAARSVLAERGSQVADRFAQLSDGMAELDTAGSERLDSLVDRVNDLADHVAELNGRILAQEAGGGHAADLRDARDVALDELSGLVGGQVVERANGSVGVYVDGQALVDGTVSRQIEPAHVDGAGIVLQFSGSQQRIRQPSGRVGALIDVLDHDLADARAAINDLARDFVQAVNDIHEQGVGPAGESGIDFFKPFATADPGMIDTAAGHIQLSDAVGSGRDGKPGTAFIAAGNGAADPTSATGWSYLAGNNTIALAIEALRDGGLGEAYTSLVAGTGATAAAATSSASVHDTLVRQVGEQRESVSGVSLDEELTAMISQQAAYGAAARVVSRVDEMLQTLLNMA